LVSIVTIAAFKSDLKAGNVHDCDKIWRVMVGLSLVPAFGTLYQRLTLPESRKFELTKAHGNDSEVEQEKVQDHDLEKAKDADSDRSPNVKPVDNDPKHHVVAVKREHYQEFFAYFSTWPHLKVLLGTTLSWFFVDIAFYGINLNQSVVLAYIGYGGTTGDTYDKLFAVATGNIIITALGFLPGYYVTLFTIEYLGRKNIQLMGFAMAALFLGILAGEINSIGKGPLLACFTFLQFFFNFGANTTTFVVAAESYPTRIRATAHGLSAACGKCGAILSSLVFNQLKASIGTANVLWIFFATSLAGGLVTFLIDETAGIDPDEKDEAERRAKGEI